MATRDLSVRAGWLLWVSAVDPSLHSGQKKHTISAAPMFVPIEAALVSAMRTYCSFALKLCYCNYDRCKTPTLQKIG